MIIGSNTTEKARNRKMLYFSTSSN